MNLIDYLNIEITNVSKEYVELSLPISTIHHQPFGFLHGGISGVLIETACSIGANQHLSPARVAIGVDLHVHHLNKAQTGQLRVLAQPIKIGQTIQFWTADVFLEDDYMIASGSCTLTVKNKKE